ncbi:hypothetical protein RSOLAG22IIIB_03235 [Rhizoctonia solani]|uniref:Peptidase S8/S53 domain-containing protein n=1 Tax=Rhizoctonia solani TaxID=456999 RepID=A0A0K6FNJ7_9AGAM|nr:hypothetical protein RSOLAG22IIIB_03235 [Rhizoctonia solani]
MDDGDTIGHGANVAGIIGGNNVDVAKYANTISVKVLARVKEVARIVEAIEWLLKQVAASGNPSIINMSLVSGGKSRQDVDEILRVAVARGVHVVAAAGNENRDARDLTPSSSGYSDGWRVHDPRRTLEIYWLTCSKPLNRINVVV